MLYKIKITAVPARTAGLSGPCRAEPRCSTRPAPRAAPRPAACTPAGTAAHSLHPGHGMLRIGRNGMFYTDGSPPKKEQLPGDNSVQQGLFRAQKLDIFQSLAFSKVIQALTLKWITENKMIISRKTLKILKKLLKLFINCLVEVKHTTFM